MANSVAAVAPGRTTKSSAAFNLSPPSSSSSSSDGGDDSHSYANSADADAPLPFPAALPRSDFLAPDFQPAAYLSALPHRHQTLEDLRSDLRDRSAAISAELLELVNSNYTSFLSLGSELRGGEDRVGDVKVALLGFRRAVEDVRGRVSSRGAQAQKLSGELSGVRRDMETGRRMLDVSERVSELEGRLALGGSGGSGSGAPVGTQDGDEELDLDDSDLDSEDEEEDDGHVDGLLGSSPAKLTTLAQDCRRAATLLSQLDQDHAFTIKLEERLARCRSTLLLDLGNALREAKGAGPRGQDRVMRYLGIYRILDAQKEAVKALRGG